MKRQSVAGRQSAPEDGFLLIALVVAIFIIALFATIAAPTVARSLERDKEVESEHRAQQYVRAIHNYYLKFNSYPTSVDQLLSQNNMHFLRQQYKDPLTGGDYRLIHFGEAKTEVKGFFGEPLQALGQGTSGALGPASGSGSSGTGSAPAAGSSPSPSGSGGFSLGSSSFSSAPSGGASTAASGAASTPGAGSSGTGSSSSGTGGSSGGTNGAQSQGSKGLIVGVGSNATGHGLVEWNGSGNIEDWEFLYDHRTWTMKQQVSIFGGSAGQSGGSSFGANPAGTGATPGSTGSGTGSTPPGSSPSSGSFSPGPGSSSGTGAGSTRQTNP